MRTHLTAWLLNALLLSPTAVEAAMSNLYVFGDSLSDNGRGADVLGVDYQFPYSSIPADNINRVSNGPVAAEKTASLLGLPLNPALIGSSTPAAGTNYAVVGALANPIGLNTLGGQISAFQDNHPGGAPSDALYLVFIAGNDVLDIKDESSDFAAALAISLATQGVESAVETLIDAGARNILVPNVFDIGLTPSAANSALATQRTMEYNAALAAMLADLETREGIDLFEYDLFDLSQRIAADPGSFDLTNITDPCTDGNVLFPSFLGSCDATVINEYAFIDDIHPTVTVHDIIGTEFFATVIPVPAALPLLGSALFVVGIWFRRRR